MKPGRTLVVALVGSLLMWAAQPPLALGWLGWVAPMPWIALARQESLTGWRAYSLLWLAAFVFWMAAMHWLRLPHPAVYLGWIALSAYLAIYLPLFVGLTRVARLRVGVPLWLAAPVVWVGLELARAHVMTGFMMGSLAHSQARWPLAIQISDLAGEYAVDFVMLLVAAAIVECGFRLAERGFSHRSPAYYFGPLLPASLMLAATLGYGDWRLRAAANSPPPRIARLALIQGNSLADWKRDAAKQQQIMNEYFELSKQAVEKAAALDQRPIDLVVWPETMFRIPLVELAANVELPQASRDKFAEFAASAPKNLAGLTELLGAPLLTGIDRIVYRNDPVASPPDYVAFNSSVLVDRAGKLQGTYDKFHLVMFGEYVPFSKYFPFLERISSLTGAVEAGAGPVAMELEGLYYAPSICYETVIPHVIRRQVAALDASGERPDVLVNLTNDAWYWGSNELDMHLNCDIFRAVETRTPLVVAANGGLSASIDRYGRIQQVSGRLQPEVILADVAVDRAAPIPWYVRGGDWFAMLCLTCCVLLAIIGWKSRAADGANAAA